MYFAILVIMASDAVTSFLLMICSLGLITGNPVPTLPPRDFICPPSEFIQPCLCHLLEPIPAVQCSNVHSLNTVHQALGNHFMDITIPSLKLRNCGFNELPSRAFSNLRMTRLHISNADFEFLRPDAFEGLNSLMSLALHNVMLFDFPTDALARLPSLIVLSLAENKITRIEQTCLRGLNTLKHLILKENRIAHIDRRSFPPGLVSLSISNNHLTSLNMAIRQLSNLETLFVEKNRLSSIVGEFEGLYNLRTLYLNGNLLKDLNDSFRYLGKLKLLELQYNTIEDLGRSLDGLTKLRVLNISHNFLFSIDSTTFRDLTSLEILDMSNNNLLRLDGSLHPTTRLKVLDLSKNGFYNFTFDDIHTLVNLTKLNLEDNFISLLISDEEYSQELKLTKLKLSNNKLENLQNFLRHFPYLRRVDVSYNDISRVRERNFLGLQNLEYINLHGNPLVCDTEQLDTFRRIENRRIEIIGRPTCSNYLIIL